jgi:hypothetical protein
MAAQGAVVLALAYILLTSAEINPPPVAGAVPVAPTSAYREWFQELEACTGIWRDFGALRFYKGHLVGNRLGQFSSTRQIVLETALVDFPEQHEFLRQFARHEMLHALIGDPQHQSRFFRERVCGAV